MSARGGETEEPFVFEEPRRPRFIEFGGAIVAARAIVVISPEQTKSGIPCLQLSVSGGGLLHEEFADQGARERRMRVLRQALNGEAA